MSLTEAETVFASIPTAALDRSKRMRAGLAFGVAIAISPTTGRYGPRSWIHR
jgi:hypothetical protein